MEADQRERDERAMVELINSVLESFQQPQIQRIGQIYAEMDANLLTTFSELDHYPHRVGNSVYLGPWSGSVLKANDADHNLPVDMPEGKKTKIFAYLKPSRAVPELLRWISGQGFSALVVGDGIDKNKLEPILSDNVRIHTSALPIETVRRWCDVAILNASHGTTCDLLMAGKPLLQIPLAFEQEILARRTVDMGAALDASPEQPRQAIQQLSALIGSASHAREAQAFAERHHDFDPINAFEECIRQIQTLI
ncbi:glycosyltransferase [Bremerella volcania]|nr:hypothetical protein [Bremerella volcania]